VTGSSSSKTASSAAKRLEVRAQDLRSVEAGPAGGHLVGVGVPVLETDDGPLPPAGLPDSLTIAGVSVPLAIPGELALRQGFRGRRGESLTVSGGEGPTVVHLGCGRGDDLTTDALRRASAALVRAAGRKGQALFLLPGSLASQLPAAPAGESPLPPAPRRAAQAVAEGALLAGYRFSSHKSKDDDGPVDAVVVAAIGIEADVLQEGVRRGTSVAYAVSFARDLVNEPPSTMTPRRMAAAVDDYLAGRAGVSFEAWDEERIDAERLGGLLAVARGSAEPPRLLRATFDPADPVEVDGRVPHVALVGKGITFDSGGLSLKSPDAMVTMKTDMSGAAAVLSAVGVCGDLGVRIRVTAIAPVTENMPGGRAQKPGDVLTVRNGKTIEVLNTDAEGRLVLADGLVLASELSPDVIVDVATLTGASVVALGRSIGGIFGTDDVLVDRLRSAAARGGEQLWPLPLADEYRSDIDSDVADMKNVGKAGQAGAIVAALLLERFVEGAAWAHLDIAGPARSDESSGVLAKGATGFGVRTLLEFLERYGSDPAPLRPRDGSA
jgi:leucyl aminopeptidase